MGFSVQRMGNKQNELELLVQEGEYSLIDKTEPWWGNSQNWNEATEGSETEREHQQSAPLHIKTVIMVAL